MLMMLVFMEVSIWAVKVAPSFTVKPGFRIISLAASKVRFPEASTVVGAMADTVIVLPAFSVRVVVIINKSYNSFLIVAFMKFCIENIKLGFLFSILMLKKRILYKPSIF